MVKRKKLLEWELPPEPQACEAPGCQEAGDHRAPHSRDNISNYHWFCLEHVRQYNSTWNFFEGMDQEDIEKFQERDVFGHRPTWPLGFGPLSEKHNSMEEQINFFAFGGDNTNQHKNTNPFLKETKPKIRKALAALELDSETSVNEIKHRYKQLVKKYHPDLNGNDKKNEERLKNVNEAYAYLMTCNYR